MNPEPVLTTINLKLNGASKIGSKATVITLAGSPEDTNSIQHPRNVVPVTTTMSGVKPEFTYTLPPSSIVVLKFSSRR